MSAGLARRSDGTVRRLIGLDTMVFVYHFESDPAYGAAAEQVLRSVEAGEISAVASTLVVLETLVVPKRARDDSLRDRYRLFFRAFPNLSFRPVDLEVAEVASDLRARYRVRTPDAVHLATAIAAGADAFVTADRTLRTVREIEVVTLGAAHRS